MIHLSRNKQNPDNSFIITLILIVHWTLNVFTKTAKFIARKRKVSVPRLGHC